MFALVVPDHPVVTESTTLSPTQCTFTIPGTINCEQFAIFLLPGASLPPDSAAAIYLKKGTNNDFRFIGALALDKPSAIFNVDEIETADQSIKIKEICDIILGISIEPVWQVKNLLSTLQSSTNTNKDAGLNSLRSTTSETTHMVVHSPDPVTTTALAQRIVSDAFNYLSSFSYKTAQGNEVIPLQNLMDWWKKFQRKLESDPTFLERDQKP